MAYAGYPVTATSPSLASTGLQTRRFAIWEPPSLDQHAGQGRFITASGDSVRMYAVEQPADSAHGTRAFKAIAVRSDLPQIRCLAWSTADPMIDLVAAGTTSGRTVLFTFPRTTAASASSTSTAPDQVVLAARNSRPCASVAFDPTGKLLAIGLEKARDFGLQVFDVERAAGPLRPSTSMVRSGSLTRPFARRNSAEATASSGDNASPARVPPSAGPATGDSFSAPLAQTASTEAINAVSFTHSSPSVLLAAASSKIIRQYDLRATGLMSVSQWSTRSVLGLEPDPFMPSRFATWGDDGVVRIWDVRKPNESLLMFSEENAGTRLPTPSHTSTESPMRTTKSSIGGASSAGSISSVAWSRTRPGVLAVLPTEGSAIRLWDIVSNAPPDAPSDSLACSLYSDTLTRSFSRPVHTMVSASLSSSSSGHSFLTVAKDGHVEILTHLRPGSAAFGARGDVVYSAGDKLRISPSKAPPITNLLIAPAGGGFVFTPPPSRHRSPSLGGTASLHRSHVGKEKAGASRAGGTETPRPALRPRNGSTRSLKSMEDSDQYNSDSAPPGSVWSRQVRLRLPEGADAGDEADERPGRSDIGRRMIKRVHAGYGADPRKNEQVAAKEDDRTMEDFWAWVAHADAMAHDGRATEDDDHDFDFVGVLPLLAPSSSSGRRHPRSATSSPPPTVFEDFSRTLRRTDHLRSVEAQLASACASFNRSRAIDPFVAVSSGTKSQRQLGLAMCGRDYVARDVEKVVRGHEEAGRWSVAAGIAFFAGHTQRAIKSVQRSDDPQLKLLGPILATHLSTQQQGLQRDSFFVDSVRHLASDRDAPDPYVRAMLAYVASGEWRDVVDETSLPLRERVACGLRFLGDDELVRWLEGVEAQAVKGGELDGVLLTGLVGEKGLDLVKSHVNRTGDVQTAALALHLVVGRQSGPSVLSHATGGGASGTRWEPAERWIATYRGLLDRWRLFNVRARFDVARGKRLREAASHRPAGQDGTTGLVKFAPPGLWMRCQYCNDNVSIDVSTAQAAKKVPRRTTQCSTCHKTLPKCSVCLLPLGIGDPKKNAWAWCHRCRHTGHAEHLQQWRDRGHSECPVAGCDCECWSSGAR